MSQQSMGGFTRPMFGRGYPGQPAGQLPPQILAQLRMGMLPWQRQMPQRPPQNPYFGPQNPLYPNPLPIDRPIPPTNPITGIPYPMYPGGPTLNPNPVGPRPRNPVLDMPIYW